MPGKVVRFWGHTRASAAGLKPKMAGSACLLCFANASEKIKKCSGGMKPRVFQLLTADMPTPATPAAAAVPPTASTMASTVLSMPLDSSRIVNLSSLHASAVDYCQAGRFDSGRMEPLRTTADRLRATREILEPGHGGASALCEKIECSTTRWSNFEGGKRRITLDVAVKLCDRYGLTLDWIYRGDPSGLPQRLNIPWAPTAERRRVAGARN